MFALAQRAVTAGGSGFLGPPACSFRCCQSETGGFPDATDALANEKYNWIESQIDHVFVVNFLASMRGTSAEQIFALSNQLAEDPDAGIGKDAYIAVALGITAPRLVGSCETVAQKIEALHANGIESVLMCFFDPRQGLHQMQDHIIPIMKKMG